MFAEDLSVFFDATEFASAATWGSLTADVILSSPTEDVLGGRATGVAYEAVMAGTSFPAIARGEEIAIDGVTYRVREVRRDADGALKRLLLALDA
jgi:hypothetical protein